MKKDAIEIKRKAKKHTLEIRTLINRLIEEREKRFVFILK